MADEPDTGTQGDLEPGATGADDETAALIAELDAEQGRPAKKPARPKPKDEPAPEPELDGDADPDDESDGAEATVEDPGDPDEDEPDDEDEDPDPDEEDPGNEDELDAEAAKDPALKKRIEAVRRTEQRQRQRLEQERAELGRERSAFQAETTQLRTAVTRIEGLVARVKIDPAAVLEALGLTADDMEYAGQQCYARGKAAAGKPEYRVAAERAARDRELAEKVAASDKRTADLEAKLAAKESQAAAERDLDAYFDRAFHKATDATPITARLIAKRPRTARAELAATAGQLVAKLGRMPKAAELLAAHEKREVRALKLRGITPPTPGTGKPAVVPGKPAVKPAAAARPAAKPAAAEDDEDAIVIPTAADLVKELQAARQSN